MVFGAADDSRLPLVARDASSGRKNENGAEVSKTGDPSYGYRLDITATLSYAEGGRGTAIYTGVRSLELIALPQQLTDQARQQRR